MVLRLPLSAAMMWSHTRGGLAAEPLPAMFKRLLVHFPKSLPSL